MNKDFVSPKPYPCPSIAGRSHKDSVLELVMLKTAYCKFR